MKRVSWFLLKPTYSVAELLGMAVIWRAFDLSEWVIAIPLMCVWIVCCTALAEKVRAA